MMGKLFKFSLILFNKVNCNKHSGGVSGQRSTSRVQAHMERPSFVSKCFIKQSFGACSDCISVYSFRPNSSSFFSSLWGLWSSVFQHSPSHPPLVFPFYDSIGVDGCLEWRLMAGLWGFASHGGGILSRAGCQQWKPLDPDTPGTHLPYKWGSS